MPKVIEQPSNDESVMRLYTPEEARKFLRVGVDKWYEICGGIEKTMIGAKAFYSSESLNRFVRRQTRKRGAGREQRAAP